MQWTAGIPNQQHDDSLFASGGHFTQSSHWAATQAALGNQVFYAQDNGWQCVAILELGRFDRRIYAPYGPHVTKKGALKPALEALRRLAIAHNAILARIEPTGVDKITTPQVLGLASAARDIQPRYTWIKDLTKSQEDLLAEMSSTNRNLYRTAANKELSFKTSRAVGDMQIFLDMLHDVATHTGMNPRSDDKFNTIASVLIPRGAATLYIALHQEKPVASAFVYDSPTTRYYAHAGAYREARKLHPGSPLLSHMIFDAKANGQAVFDFFGVAPPDQPDHKWAGFTTFKQSFGGEYKEYSGTWELPVKQLAYKKYRLLLKAHRVLRGK